MTAEVSNWPNDLPVSGDIIKLVMRRRLNLSLGTLWERVSDVDGTLIDKRGFFIGFYVVTPDGEYPRGRQPFDTYEEAQAWIDANYALFPCNIVTAHRFTKSGKVYRLRNPRVARTPVEEEATELVEAGTWRG